MTMTHDGQVAIAVGDSRRCVSWQNKELLWSDLAKRLNVPTRTPETEIEYKALAKSKRDEIKDVGGFVGGTLKNGRRKADNLQSRRLITLDIDNVPSGVDPWHTVNLIIGCAAVLYSTHSHTPKAPRLRLVLPLSRPVNPDEYAAISRRIAGDIGIDMCDDTTYEPHRLMYWPSLPLDAEYRYEVSDAPWLDVDKQLKRYTDWKDPSQWPVSSRKAGVMERLAKKQGDPTEKNGIVGAFCRVYSIEDVIEQFLPEVYSSCGDGRYTYAGGSTNGGLVLYENGLFAYSHHGTDPVSGKLCNAFDLVRLHLFGEQDDSAVPGTPVNRLPSYSSMSDLAIGDKAVRNNLTISRLKEVTATFGEYEDTDWVDQLVVNSKGKIETTIDNALVILEHDSELKGTYYFDEFRERPIVATDLPWQALEERVSDCWSDSDDAGLRLLLEKRYDIDSAFKIRDAVELAMLKAKRHPVREYLNSLEWDGTPRADTLFIEHLGAEDSKYTREVTKKSLLGAVARIMKPGCKHDHMLVLVGPQGCRKSTTLNMLGKTWFSDSLYTMTGKDAYEQLQGSWIIELSEMAATRKAEVEQTKQFISKQTDSYRAAYARRAQEHPRQCAFFGTTNDSEFLRDSTGGRRFWPVVVTNKASEEGWTLTSETIDQIWAETVIRYNVGENWYLDKDVEQIARKVQEEHTEGSSLYGPIANFVEILLPADWDDWPLENRLMFFNGGFSGETEGTVPRQSICALEIWQEHLKGNPLHFNRMQAREINSVLKKLEGWKPHSSYNCGRIYGRQRAFIRSDLLENAPILE